MKLQMEGFEVECTVEEFLKLQELTQPKEELTPYQELQRLEHWILTEIEVENGRETTATLVSKGEYNPPPQKKTSIEAMGDFWRSHYDFD